MTLTNEQKVRRFEKALAQAGNTHSISDVMQRIEQNRACCWTNGDSVVVTEVLMFPRLRAVNYWLVSGKLQECAALQPDIDAWAVSEGCSVATATGRMGWLRLSETPLGAGWKPAGVKFCKELVS
jgi:hypothetical protein